MCANVSGTQLAGSRPCRPRRWPACSAAPPRLSSPRQARQVRPRQTEAVESSVLLLCRGSRPPQPAQAPSYNHPLVKPSYAARVVAPALAALGWLAVTGAAQTTPGRDDGRTPRCDPTFSIVQRLETGRVPAAVVAADLNGDGRLAAPARGGRALMANVTYEHVTKRFDDTSRLKRPRARGRRRRVPGARRALRLRQDDGAPHARRPRGDQRRAHPDRRPGRQQRRPGRPRHGDGLPVVRALPAHDGARQPRFRAAQPQGAEAEIDGASAA